MSKQIVDEDYAAGGKAYRKGKRLRDLIQPILDAEDDKPAEGQDHKEWFVEREKKNNKQMSALIGYFDAFIEQMRR